MKQLKNYTQNGNKKDGSIEYLLFYKLWKKGGQFQMIKEKKNIDLNMRKLR